MHRRQSWSVALVLAGVAVWLGGCQTRREFPEPAAGWHAGDYGVVFGRLQRVAAADPEEPAAWAVRFGEGGEAHGGRLTLTPGGMMTGFAGGDLVEVRGRLVGEAGGGGTGDTMRGIHYAVESIRLWAGYRE